ncbi:MAG: PHP domain-containing protein [Candidatus Heimdallarchaeota archaeon]|nr:PHP domain-containing protein [Candidatus Heimdallarchaeota archaeon]
MKVDIHSHSTHSDGTKPVTELLKMAEERRLEVFAITDHDTFAGSLEAFEKKEGLFSGTLIAGIEISTRVNKKKVHLLAYFKDTYLPMNDQLFINLEKIRNDRIRRMRVIIDNANNAGFKIEFDEVNREAGGDDSVIADVLGRPHFARVFARKYNTSVDYVFDTYLGDGKPWYAKRFSLKFHEWIDQVRNLGGLISWAHPLQGHHSLDTLEPVCELLVEKIDAIELNYIYDGKYKINPDFYKSGISYLRKQIADHDLLVTAGGDYHGDVGTLGEVSLEEEAFNKFITKLNK